MDVLLVAPYRISGLVDSEREDFLPSQALICLASYLRLSGHQPFVLDFNNSRVHRKKDPNRYCIDELLNGISKHCPELVGINCLFSGLFPTVLKYVDAIKNQHPDIKIAIGGIHATTHPKEILENTSIDYIVIGEGERQIVDITNMIETDDFSAIDQINSFAYLDKSGQAKINRNTSLLDYDELPMPAWDLVNFSNFEMDLHHYNNPKNFNFKTIVPVVSERGCPFRCNFCDLYLIQGRKLRRKSANKFVDELEVLNKEYGQNYFSFMDDNLTVDRKHIISICKEIIRRRLNIQFGTVGGLHVNSLDDEIIELMVEAGMVDALIAPEHGSDYMRNVVIKKMLEREKIYEVVEIIQKYKVNLGGNWIMGFPEETNDTLTDMYNMIEDLKLDRNSVGTAIPFPGTELFDQCIRDDLFVDNIDVNSLWSTPIWAFKTFDNDAPPKSEFLIKPYDMELEELATWREKFNDVRYKYFGYFHDEFKQPKRFWATDANQLQGNQPSTAI